MSSFWIIRTIPMTIFLDSFKKWSLSGKMEFLKYLAGCQCFLESNEGVNLPPKEQIMPIKPVNIPTSHSHKHKKSRKLICK